MDLDAIVTLGMNTSVPQTRVRPLVWNRVVDGGYGLDGDPNTTIASLDSGLDMTHPDLTGKLEYWHDFHEGAIPTVQDFNGHGTFVAGIACGTCEVGGSNPIDELSCTYWSLNWDYWDEGVNLNIPVLGSGQVTLDLHRRRE